MDYDFDLTAERGGGLLEEPERRLVTMRATTRTREEAERIAAEWLGVFFKPEEGWRAEVRPGAGPREGAGHVTVGVAT